MSLIDKFKFARAKRNLSDDYQKETVKPPDENLRFVVGVPATEGDPVPTITAQRLAGILSAAEVEGEVQEQASLIDHMKIRDPFLEGLLEARKKALLGCDWDIMPPDAIQNGLDNDISQTPEGQDAIALKNELKLANLDGLLEHLSNAVDYGYAASQILWKPGGDGIYGFDPFHQTTILFDKQGNPGFYDKDNKEVSFAKYPEHQFILHTNCAPGYPPMTSGIARKVAWWWFFKYGNTKSWIRYNEKCGVPYVFATISRADYESEDRRKKIVADLMRMSRDTAFAMPQGSKIESASPTGHDNSIHLRFASYADENYMIMVCGQTAPASAKSGVSSNEIQEMIRADIKEDDCKALMRTIQHNLIYPLWYFRHGSIEKCPVFIMNFRRQKDLKYMAEVFTTMDMRNWRPTDYAVSQSMGISFRTVEPMEDGKDETPLKTKTKKVETRVGDKDKE